MSSLNQTFSTLVTATGAPQTIQLDRQYQEITILNQTAFGRASATPSAVKALWNYSMANGSALIETNVASSTALQTAALVAAPNGITQGAVNQIYTSNQMEITGVTAANPAVFSVGGAGVGPLQSGQTVWISTISSMAQFNAMPITVGSVNTVANTFTAPFLDTTGMTAGGAGVCWVIYGLNQMQVPATNYITKIVNGATTQITLGVAIGNTLRVGNMVDLAIPAQYGSFPTVTQPGGALMNPSNFGGFQVTAINTTTNTITVNVNTIGSSTFTWPLNSTVTAVNGYVNQKAQVIPVGNVSGNLQLPSSVPNKNILLINTGVPLVANDSLLVMGRNFTYVA